MKLVYWTLLLVIAAVLGCFAASNRQDVTLALWPFAMAAAAPLYLAILGSMLVGFILGALSAWIRGGRWRKKARRRARRIVALERELAATQAQLPAPSEAAAGVPARVGI